MKYFYLFIYISTTAVGRFEGRRLCGPNKRQAWSERVRIRSCWYVASPTEHLTHPMPRVCRIRNRFSSLHFFFSSISGFSVAHDRTIQHYKLQKHVSKQLSRRGKSACCIFGLILCFPGVPSGMSPPQPPLVSSLHAFADVCNAYFNDDTPNKTNGILFTHIYIYIYILHMYVYIYIHIKTTTGTSLESKMDCALNLLQNLLNITTLRLTGCAAF